MMFSVFLISIIKCFTLIINTQSFQHNNILTSTIKCFMLDYKYTEPSTKDLSLLQIKELKGITLPGYIQMYPGKVISLNSLIYL